MVRFPQFILFLSFIILMISSCSDSSPTPDEDLVEYDSIPTISIQTAGSIPWDKKKECLTFFMDKGDTIEIGARIKCRGGMSSRYEKHSYSIEFDEYLKIGGAPADDDWILNASYIDKTFQRHKLSYDLYRQMDTNNVASKCEYIKVLLNGKYIGLYIAMQEINGSMIGLDKTDPNAMLFKDPPIFYDDPLTVFSDSINPYQQKFPKIKLSPRTQFLDEFNAFLFSTTDEEFEEFIGDWIDLENVLNWHLILLLSNNDDGLFKNFYLYRLNAEKPMRIAIWDYDHSFGRDSDGTLNRMEEEIRWERILLLSRLMDSEALNYAGKLKMKWFELREDLFTKETIESMMDENTKVLQPNLKENFEKWPLESKWYKDGNNYDQEIKIMKDYLEMRLNYLDDFMEKLD